MSKNNKKLAKKKAHEREARKRVLDKRMALRQERKDERIREEAYEKAFREKQNLGLTNEEIKAKLEHSMKMLEALEEEYDQSPDKQKNTAINQQIKESMDKFKEEIDKKLLEKSNVTAPPRKVFSNVF